MARGYRRKCKCCLKFFRPDPCNRRHQRYCAAPPCRRASKAASQARWLGKPANQGYFRDPWHVARVRAWRSRNPGYWRKGQRPATALQDVITAQPAVLIGLIAHLVGTPLQEDLVRTTDRLLRLGQDILAMSQGPPAVPP
jgi:hypothetical protein